MFSLGPMEIVILLGIGLVGIGGLVVLFFIIRAAVQSGNRNSDDRN